MKILMLNPPFLYRFSRTSRSPAISKGGCVYYPIWMGYATGVLEKAGHEVKLLDCPASGMKLEEVVQIAKDWKPELIVVDSVTASFNNDVKVTEAMKDTCPEAFTIMVGTHVGALPEMSLRQSRKIDAVARGEYDYILRDLAEALEKKKPLDTVLGITYWDIEAMDEGGGVPGGNEGPAPGKHGFTGKIRFTPNMPPIEQEGLDDMPFASEVYSRHLRIKDYFYPSVLWPEVTIITGRGCKFRCTFCIDADSVVAVKENEQVKVDSIAALLDAHLDKEGKNIHGYDLLNTQNKDLQIWSNGEFVKVKGISRIKESKRLNIRLSNGTSIEMTADHIVPVLRGNETLELRAGEISMGDKVKFSNPLPEGKEVNYIDVYRGLAENVSEKELKDVYIHGVNEYFSFLEEAHGEEFSHEYRNFKTGWKQNDILPILVFRELERKYGLPEAIAQRLEIGGKNILPLQMHLPVTKELMTIIGFFVSEGNYNNFNLAVAKSDSKMREEIINCIKTVFPKTYVTQTKGSDVRGAQVYFGGLLVYLLFKKILEIPTGAANKKLPWIVFNVGSELQNECLKALYSGDGGWDKARKIGYYTSSKILANQLMVLLAKKGINYSLSMQDNTGEAFIHRITINDWHSRQKFAEQIGFFGQRQQEILEYQAAHKPNRVAVLEKLQEKKLNAREIAQELGITHTNARQTIAELAGDGSIEKTEITRRGFVKQVQYMAVVQPYKNTVPAFLEVTAIENTVRSGYVYDVETENSHFTANGIVVHNCKFPQTLTGHSYRARSPKNVVDEFEWISKNLPYVKDIMIEDDTMTQDKGRMIEICKEIEARNLRTTWTCNARADVDLETLDWMKKAGCRLLCVGFESADQQILNNIKKGTRVEKIEQFMVDTKKANMLVHGCFMLGNNGETRETIKKTVEWAKKLEPDTAQFFPLMLYPGTEAFRWASENKFLATTNWDEWLTPEGTHNTILNTDKLSAADLVAGCDWARKEFYWRPEYILSRLKLMLTQPREAPRLMMGAKTFMKYLLNIDFWKKSAAEKQVSA